MVAKPKKEVSQLFHTVGAVLKGDMAGYTHPPPSDSERIYGEEGEEVHLVHQSI